MKLVLGATLLGCLSAPASGQSQPSRNVLGEAAHVFLQIGGSDARIIVGVAQHADEAHVRFVAMLCQYESTTPDCRFTDAVLPGSLTRDGSSVWRLTVRGTWLGDMRIQALARPNTDLYGTSCSAIFANQWRLTTNTVHVNAAGAETPWTGIVGRLKVAPESPGGGCNSIQTGLTEIRYSSS